MSTAPGRAPRVLMPAPRVLMVVPQYPYPVTGGLERQAHELAKALVERGLEVQALSGRTDPAQPDVGVVEGVRVHRVASSPHKLLRALLAPWGLLRIMLRERHTYDVVHLHQTSAFSLYCLLIARWLGKPVLIKLPNVGDFGLPGLVAQPLGALRLAVFRRADAVVAMSRESVRELQDIGFPATRVLLTPNGIRVLDRPAVGTARAAGDGPVRCVFVGRLSAEKGLDGLLRAWAGVVAAAGRPVALDLWGTGPEQAELARLARDLGLDRTVAFRGHVEAVRDKLPGMDVFVLPSFAEGNSNAVLEAMAAGLPVVSTRVGGTAMQVGAEGARFLVAPGDEQGLAERLLELVQDADLRARTGEAMRRRILAHFDIRRVADTYAAAYELLASARGDELPAIASPVIATD